MKISIVVVAWRSRDPLASCLESLPVQAGRRQVVVVDNASGDGTAAMVRARFPGVELIENAANIGFAAGCNLGAARANGDLILFLNPDTRALAGAVDTLAAALAADPDAAAAGGALLDDGGMLQGRYGPRALPSFAALARNVVLGQAATAPPLATGIHPVGQVAGACLMIRRRDFLRLGGFDEAFRPVFFEDVDLCRRLAAIRRRILFVPTAGFAHHGGASVRRMDAASHYRAWFDNLLRYAGKHHGHGRALLLRLLTVPGALLRLASTLLPGGGGRFGRRARAGAFLHIALRNISPWSHASQSTS